MLTTLTMENELREIIPFTGLYEHCFETLYIQKEYYSLISYKSKWYYLKHVEGDSIKYDLLPLGKNWNSNIIREYVIGRTILPKEWMDLQLLGNYQQISKDYIYNTEREELKSIGLNYKQLNKNNIYDVFKLIYKNSQTTIPNFIVSDGESAYNSSCILLKKAFTFNSIGILAYNKTELVGCLIGYPLSKEMFCGYIFECNNENYEHIFNYFCDLIKKMGYTEINMCDNPTAYKDALKPDRFIERYFYA